MAETLETISSGVEVRESIARIELFTDAKLDPEQWSVRFHFERGPYAEGAAKPLGETQFGSRVVSRSFGQIAAKQFNSGMTGTQIAGVLRLAGYELRAEDIAAEEAAQAGNGE